VWVQRLKDTLDATPSVRLDVGKDALAQNARVDESRDVETSVILNIDKKVWHLGQGPVSVALRGILTLGSICDNVNISFEYGLNHERCRRVPLMNWIEALAQIHAGED
jgi:hypothetical protein